MELREYIEQALASEDVFTFHYDEQNRDYVSESDLIDKVFALGLGAERWDELQTFLAESRVKFGLGAKATFFPPQVPPMKRGDYYHKIVLPSDEEVSTALAEVMQTVRTLPSRYEPKVEVKESTLIADLYNYMVPYEQRFYGDPIKDFLLAQVKRMLAEQGWTREEYGDFTRPMSIKKGETDTMDIAFDGRILDAPWTFIAKDAYGFPYRLQFEEFPAEFQEYALEMLGKYGYVMQDGKAVPKPVELPDTIEAIGRVLLMDNDLIKVSKYGHQVILLKHLQAALAECGVELSLPQMEAQLLGREGVWREALILNGFGTEVARTINTSDLNVFGDDIKPHEPGITKRRRAELTLNEDRKVSFAAGLPVVATRLLIDSGTETLVCLEMAGSLSSVRANWAALVQDKWQAFRGSSFRVGSGKNFKLFKSTLPSGMHHWGFVNEMASPMTIDTSMPKFYLITNDRSDDVPKGFIGMLDKFLEIPIRPEWAETLWVLGRVTGLIDYTGDPNKHIGGTCWTIRRGSVEHGWTNLIPSYLRAGRLSFPTCG